MGFFSRRTSSATAPAGTTSNSSSSAGAPLPPSYDSVDDDDPEQGLLQPYRLGDSPFAETVHFKVRNEGLDAVGASGNGKSAVQREESYNEYDVSISIPKVSYTKEAPGKQPSMDVYIHLEMPINTISQIIVQGTYAVYTPPGHEKACHKPPWVVTGTLAAALLNRNVELLATGRFTQVAKWTIRPSMSDPTPYRLSGAPQAICATSSYFGPCTLTLKIGITTSSRYTYRALDAEPVVVWKSVSRPIILDGQDIDHITGFLHAVNGVKLLGSV